MRRAVILLCVAAVAAVGGHAALGGTSSGTASRLHGRVIRVVDGDTIHVRTGGHDETVRLIGIDTPETHRPDTPIECGGPQASAAMAKRARSGTHVTLVTDPTQDRRDRYGRLLAYVDRDRDGADLGRQMVRGGFADVYVYEDRPFRRLKSYRAAARKARDEHAGVYGTCGGDFHRPQ